MLKDPLGTFQSNIQGTWNVLEAVRQAGNQIKSVLVASSDKAYGTATKLPYDENMPLRGDGPYDVSKSATDLLSRSYGVTYGRGKNPWWVMKLNSSSELELRIATQIIFYASNQIAAVYGSSKWKSFYI